MENDFHHWLKTNIDTSELVVPLGDDAAVMDWSQRDNCVVTSDLLADGSHFKLSEADPKRIGRKCLAVNLSDVAAMAATPVAAVVSLLLPRSANMATDQLAEQLIEGMLPLAREYQTRIVGGDTNTWDGLLAINVTMLAVAGTRGPLRRDQANAGDIVMVTGHLGGSIHGRHFDFQPRIAEAKQLHENYRLSAGMDISDGLALDATRLAAASGVGIELSLETIPVSKDVLARAGQGDAKTPLQHALGDGEDFELLFTAAPAIAKQILLEQPLDIPVTAVGQCISDAGLFHSSSNGPKPLAATGWEHT